MKEKQYITIIDNNDNEIKYEVLLSFMLSKTKKHYIIYTDNSFNENGDLNIYASIYDSHFNKLSLIDTQEEWKIINEKIKELQK